MTSIYIHQNLNHVVSNMLLFGGVSMHLEVKYGWWRMLLVWLVSGGDPSPLHMHMHVARMRAWRALPALSCVCVMSAQKVMCECSVMCVVHCRETLQAQVLRKLRGCPVRSTAYMVINFGI